ncbi:hypothetical protein GGR51DRAFT_407683 [Nemania sp. FL0031]|nr:hypothetical protein GGR51DRAFT_407683 [Nemania sp. FL0031]
MEPSNIPDNATFWGDDNDMREQAEKYKEWALSLINNIDSPLLPPTARHPWQDQVFNLDEKVCIFERIGDQNSHDNKDISSAKELKDKLLQWEKTSNDNSTGNYKNGRIILLQDLHPRIIELLGVKLGIPPHFFLSHCFNQLNLNVVDGTYSNRDDSTYWKVRVPRALKFMTMIGVPLGHCYIESGSIIRDTALVRSPARTVLFSNAVSCWTKTTDPNSWTAVILMDPHNTYARAATAQPGAVPNSPDRCELFDLRGISTFYQVLDSGTRSDMGQLPLRSIFEATVAAYNSAGIPHTNDPFEGTILIRNIIRSMWESFVARVTVDVRETYVADQNEYIPRDADANVPPTVAPQNTSNIKPYQELIVLRQWIMELKDIMNPILWKFRCKDSKFSAQTPDISPEAVHHEYDSLQSALKGERKSWAILDEKFGNLETTIANQMEMWAQRAALQQATASLAQAEAATRSARTSGQLTKIATVIVPFTFVASIFSMNGRFAAGEDLFYVYWTVSIPVTLALLSWVLQNDIKDVYRNVVNTKRRLDGGGVMPVMNGNTNNTVRHRKLFHLGHDHGEKAQVQV